MVVLARSAFGVDSNIHSTNKWAWNDIVGWINFYGTAGEGAKVDDNKVSRWGVIDDNTSTYVALHCIAVPTSGVNDCPPNFGVLNDDGALSGDAWSDEYGWISFAGTSPSYSVAIDATGDFQGFAWNGVIGWISFNCANDHDPGTAGTQSRCASSTYKVNTSWLPSSTPVISEHYLESTTFDTGSSNGFAINSIYWEGTLASSTSIGFQLAVATSTNFTGVNFLGPDNSVSTIYAAADSDGGEAIPVYSTYHHPFESGYRYFRYRVYLDKSFTSPVVTKVSINWMK